METIHLKTVDPLSQDLLRSAAREGIHLNWERYERLQPQDGFMRLGLSCPYGCLQGPCRIDPFGRGPQKGICGMGKDQMVGAMILRITLQGVLEILNGRTPEDSNPTGAMTGSVWTHFGASAISVQEIYQSILHLGSRLGGPENSLPAAVRLGLLTLELMNADEAITGVNGTVKTGYGVIAGTGAVIGVSGYPDAALLKSVCAAMEQSSSTAVQIIALGDWIRLDQQYVPIACTTGETELLVSSGCVDLVVAGPGSEPGLLELCQKLDTPVIQTDEVDGIDKKIKSACAPGRRQKVVEFAPDPSLMGEGSIAGMDKLRTDLTDLGNKPIALIGGSDTLDLPLGWIPVELSKALVGADMKVASWGDAALWMIKDGLAAIDNPSASLILDCRLGPVQAVSAMQSANKLGNLKGICFTGLKTCKDFAVALGLAGLGLDVCLAAPIPIWGSESVRNSLEQLLSRSGGSLRYFDASPHAQDILDWFEEK